MSGIQAGIATIFDKAVTQSEQVKSSNKVKAEYDKIKQCIEQAKFELRNAEINLNQVTDPKLIDMYIYRIQYAQTHYEHLLKEIKQMNI